MKKYSIYVVSPDSIDLNDVGNGEDNELGFVEIKDLAIDSKKSNSLMKLLDFLIKELNTTEVNEDFYFLCDEENQIILKW